MTSGIGWRAALLALGLLITSAEAGGDGGNSAPTPLALSSAERTAVIADSDGVLHVVRAGEALPDGTGSLVEVLADRLVVDLVSAPPPEAVEGGADGRPAAPVRAWIFPPERPGMPPRIERLDPRPPDGLPAELLIVPETLPERLPDGARVARPRAPPQAGGDPPAPSEPGSGSPDSGSTAAASRRAAPPGSER